MLRIVLLSVGIGLLIAGCVLLFFGLAAQGINDGEWRNITETGLPSAPDQFTWSSWQPNDGSVYLFSSYQPEQRPDGLPEFRIGHAKGFLFDFIFYQGRFTRDGITHQFPAIGPGWGARYHWGWSCLAFAAGLSLILAALLTRRNFSSSTSPAQPHATNVA
jgi:hypothetical protein